MRGYLFGLVIGFSLGWSLRKPNWDITHNWEWGLIPMILFICFLAYLWWSIRRAK